MLVFVVFFSFSFPASQPRLWTTQLKPGLDVALFLFRYFPYGFLLTRPFFRTFPPLSGPRKSKKSKMAKGKKSGEAKGNGTKRQKKLLKENVKGITSGE